MENRILSITMSDEYKKEILFNSLCNGLDELGFYGLQLEIDEDIFNEAKESWKEKNKNQLPCYENIIFEMLEMKNIINVIDLENDERHYFKLDLAIQYLDKLPTHCILQLLNEEDDVTTADIVLQTCLFGEVVFG